MNILKKIYFSPLGIVISFFLNLLSVFGKPFMVYGYYNRVTRKFYKLTRISSSAVILDKSKFDIGDNTWVWHYSIIDASNGVKIGTGSQIGAWVGIFSHGSQRAIRLLGEKYIYYDKHERLGYQRGSVEIGEYTFVGASSLILPGVKIGKGCLVAAGSIVSKDVPDYSIVSGNPSQVVGKTIEMDKKYFNNEIVRQCYFDKSVIEEFLRSKEKPR